jgi:glycosyltransferase involved in cell wall biosynthesis
MSNNDSFDLVVPAYNEAKNLDLLIQKTVQAAEKNGFDPSGFQLIVVNNGSQDETAKVLQNLKQGSLAPWFRVVEVVENRGYGFGILAGLMATQASIVGWSHADLQCDPENAFKAYFTLKRSSHPTLVKGERFGRNEKDIFVSRVFEALAFLILGLRVREMNAQPKVFPRELMTQLKNPPKTFAFDLYALYCASKAGFEIQTIPVLFPPRIHGVSNWASNFLSRYKTIWGIIKYMFHLAVSEGRVK